MANFGFTRLAVVAPYEPHWREAKSAVGASDLLQNAKKTASLVEAVADCTLVVGTGSLEHRKPEQPVIPLPELAPLIQNELARNGRIALVFGSEKRGLTREDLAHCHVLTVIPTDSSQPSMNLGQAVAVCLYEIASRIAPLAGDLGAPDPGSPRTGPSPRGGDASHLETWEDAPADDPPASTRDLDLLVGVVDQTMLAANYSPAAMHKANRHDLDLLLRRLALTRRDARPHSRILPSHSLAAESLEPALNAFPASSASWLPPAKFHGKPSKIPAKVAFNGSPHGAHDFSFSLFVVRKVACAPQPFSLRCRDDFCLRSICFYRGYRAADLCGSSARPAARRTTARAAAGISANSPTACNRPVHANSSRACPG